MNRLRWAMRRYALEIPANALVLEVGSGGNPYPRSNVLLDAYEETRERHWETLVHDRPTVISFGENLPFRDKAFDYVIAAHVLEHSANPEKFLAELQRVAHAGYIETPDAFMERINPYKDHRLEITVRGDRLIIRKKKSWLCDADLVEMYEEMAKQVVVKDLIPRHPQNFHVRYYWKDEIRFSVLNPEVDASWKPPESRNSNQQGVFNVRKIIRHAGLLLCRRMLSQGRRNSKLDILTVLRCPQCFSEKIIRKSDAEIVCGGCESSFRTVNSIYHIN